MENNSKAALTIRIQELIQNLDLAEQSLSDVPQVDPKIIESIRGRIALLFNREKIDLKGLQETVQGSSDLEPYWNKLMTKENASKALFREYLSLLGGLMIRSAELDGGICRIADAMLYDLSERSGQSWNRITVMDETEFFAGMTEVIRIRYPGFNIWNLPIAAHELGHYILKYIEDRKGKSPYEELLARKYKDEIKKDINREEIKAKMEEIQNHTEEHFADLFATYVLGPSYAFTCIVHRFNPIDSEVCAENKTHPSCTKRVYAILRMLEEFDLNSSSFTPPYEGTIGFLREMWFKNLESVKLQDIDDDIKDRLDKDVQYWYDMFGECLQPSVRYSSWARAEEISAEMEPNRSDVPNIMEKDSIPDILNAAWLYRRNKQVNENSLRILNERALTLCSRIIETKKKRKV